MALSAVNNGPSAIGALIFTLLLLLSPPPTAANSIQTPIVAHPPEQAAPPGAAESAFLEVLFEEDFERSGLSGITFEAGWRHMFDDRRGLVCISNYHSRYGSFPKFIFGSEDWQNYSIEIEARILPNPTRAPDYSHIALLTRLNGDWWGYRHSLGFGDWGAHIAQYYYGGVGATNIHDFSQTNLPPVDKNWHLLRAEVDGRTMRTLFDEELVIDYNVRLSPNGFAGVEVGPGAYLCVDRLVVRSLNRSPSAMERARRGVIVRDANLRLWPGFRHDRIGSLYTGEEVFILEETENWIHIRKKYSSIQGWVWRAFVNAHP
ncbi:MAG: hypothetical protein BroJett038_25090 [Chloroflexota bacterium]|nr:MAG: hypothetical protein BroJett038_25090 [Chloroflexota bacterium]